MVASCTRWNRPEGHRRRVSGALLAWVASLVVGSWGVAFDARAEVATIDLLLDVDLDDGTGCAVATADGSATGVERRLRIAFDVGLGEVTSLSTATCVDPSGAGFGPEVPVASAPAAPWSGADGNGLGGTTAIEAHWPIASLGAGRLARLQATVGSVFGDDALLVDDAGSPIMLPLGAAPVPGLGLGAAGLALGLASGLAAWSMGRAQARRRSVGTRRARIARWGATASLVGASLLLVSPTIGRALLGDGVWRTWSLPERVATDAADDGAPELDLRAIWAYADPATGELWLRVDVGFGPPICLDWGRVDPGTGYACNQEPPPDPGPFGGAVAVTFDDGPHPVHTPSIVATLRAFGVPTTFFWRGDRLLTATEQAIAQDVHADPLFRVANHTVTHRRMTTLTPAEVEYEILETSERIRDAIGDPCYFPEYFRFPFSASNCPSTEVARSLGHAVTGVHFSPHDWCYGTGGGTCTADRVHWIPDEYRSDLVGYTVYEYQRSGGGILLLHDIHQLTADSLPAILQGLLDAGATFVDLADPTLFPLLQASIQPPEAPACCAAP